MSASGSKSDRVLRSGPADRGGRSALVGVDESLGARLALDEAVARVGPGGRVVLAHCVTPPPGEPFSTPLTKLAVDRRKIAHAFLARLATQIQGPAVETRVREGSPAAQLAQLAWEEDVDELVVGSRGLGRFVAALGSVSHALLREADRPVVVIPGRPADRLRRAQLERTSVVVVGYDGSPAAHAAVRRAIEDAGPDGLVVAVHAYTPVPDWLGAPNYDEVLAAHQERGQRLLSELEQRDDLGVHLETSLLEGAPARALIAAAEARDADEIVLGSRGFSPLRGALGSVSHALLHEADRPVVIIPERAVSGLCEAASPSP